MNKRLTKDRLVIGAYILQPYAQAETHVKYVADCGIDMITCLTPKSRETLDLFEKLGMYLLRKVTIVTKCLRSKYGNVKINVNIIIPKIRR